MNKGPRNPRIKPPPVQGRKPKQPPTLDEFLSNIRKLMGFQLQTVLAEFLNSHTDEQIDAFLPEDVSEADEWIEGHVGSFTDNEEPTVQDMVDGLGAIFVMAFLEQLYEHCQVETDDSDDEGDADDEGDEDEEGEDDER